MEEAKTGRARCTGRWTSPRAGAEGIAVFVCLKDLEEMKIRIGDGLQATRFLCCGKMGVSALGWRKGGPTVRGSDEVYCGSCWCEWQVELLTEDMITLQAE